MPNITFTGSEVWVYGPQTMYRPLITRVVNISDLQYFNIAISIAIVATITILSSIAKSIAIL